MIATTATRRATPTTYTVEGREAVYTFARGLVFMLTQEAAGWAALQIGPRGIGPQDHVVVTWTHPDSYTWEGYNLTTRKRVSGMAESWLIRGFRAVGTMTDVEGALWWTEPEDVEE